MLREEFVSLTGIHPTNALYEQIEKRYMASDLNKVDFCKAYVKDQNGIATGAQVEADMEAWKAEAAMQKKIAELEKQIGRLEQKLEAEQEWTVTGVRSGMTEKEYDDLASEKVGSRFLTDEQARDMIFNEFGFANNRVTILHEVPVEEVNRHHQLRSTRTVSRKPVYNATDWNYIRFDCCGWSYEMINGGLNKI